MITMRTRSLLMTRQTVCPAPTTAPALIRLMLWRRSQWHGKQKRTKLKNKYKAKAGSSTSNTNGGASLFAQLSRRPPTFAPFPPANPLAYPSIFIISKHIPTYPSKPIVSCPSPATSKLPKQASQKHWKIYVQDRED